MVSATKDGRKVMNHSHATKVNSYDIGRPDYPNYISFQKPAEATGIETNSVDRIFCGNAYQWFDRKQVVPEFRRILRAGGKIVVTTFGGDSSVSSAGGKELSDIINN